MYEEASQELDFNQLLYRMNVVSENGSLSADEWEAASKWFGEKGYRQSIICLRVATV